jgi:hypothetical protein
MGVRPGGSARQPADCSRGSEPCGVPLSGREAGDEWLRDDRQATPTRAEQFTNHERLTAVIAAS